jgi:hypothetical protein
MRHAVLSLILVVAATPAFAQQPAERWPLWVADFRAGLTLLKDDNVTATSLSVNPGDLPGHGIGILTGVHLYPLRRATFALGMGGEMFFTNSSKQNFDPTTGDPLGPEVLRRFQSFSFQLSFNFGHPQGWSYITAGMGPVNFDTYLVDSEPDGPRTPTPNAGFGARWFTKEHVAFCLDMRFYMTRPSKATLVVGERERTNVVVMSAGISIK